MSSVARILRDDHAVVLEVLRSFERALQDADLLGILAGLEFFDEGLARHRRREIGILLPELRASSPTAEGPVSGALEEHAQELLGIENLREAINLGDSEGMLKSGISLMYALRNHCWMEEHSILPLVDRMLNPETLRHVEREMAACGPVSPPATPARQVSVRARRHGPARRRRVAS